MTKLAAAIFVAALALAAQPAAACDWNREASTAQQQVAAAPAQQPQTTATAPQTANVASDSSKPVEPTAPIVQVNDRH